VFDDLDLVESLRIYEKGVTADRPVDSFGEFQFLVRDGDIVSPRLVQREPLRNLCAEFIDCVDHHRRPLADGELGLEVVRVLEAAERSSGQSGAPVGVAR
jgi:predicted dehydrogenase